MQPIGVALVEDNKGIRELMVELLRAQPEFEFKGAFETAEKFMLIANDIRPQVVLMDIQLPGRTGIECIREMKVRMPEIQFIVWTVFEDADKIYEALCSGATGYILKSSESRQIIDSIIGVGKGESHMSGSIARKLIDHFFVKKRSEDYTKLLTEREREILDLLTEGYRYKEIANKIHISIETVRTHIRNIYEKLQVNTRTEAINKVYKM